MAEQDREVTIVIKGKNLTKAEFDAARQALAGLASETDRTRESTKKLPPELDKGKESAKGMGEGVDVAWRSVKQFAGALGVGLTVGAVAQFTRGVVEGALEVKDFSDRLNVGTEELQRMKYAAELGGATFNDLTSSVAFMNQKLGEGSTGTIATLRRVGLSLEDLRRMKSDEAFNAIVEAVRKIPDRMEQARLMVELFGRSGQALLPAMRDGFREVGEQAVVMSDRTIENLERAEKAYLRFKTSLKAQTGEIIGALTDLESAWDLILRKFDPTGQILRDDMAKGTAAAMASIPKVASPFGDMTPALKSATDVLKEFEAAHGTPKEHLARIARYEAEAKAIRQMADAWSREAVDKTIRRHADALEDFQRRGLHMTDAALRDNIRQLSDWMGQGHRLHPVQRQMFLDNLDVAASLIKVDTNTEAILRQSPNYLFQMRQAGEAERARALALKAMAEAMNDVVNKTKNGELLNALNFGPSAITGDELKRMLEAPDRVAKEWVQAFNVIGMAADTLGGDLGELLQSMVAMIQIANNPSMSATDRNLMLGSMAAQGGMAWYQASQQGNRGKGAASGAMTGAAVGTMIMPGIGTAVGAGIGAIAGALSSGGPGVNDIRDQWMAHMGGLRAIQEQIGKFANDPVLMNAFSRLYSTDSQERFQEQALRFEARLRELMGEREEAQQRLNNAIEKYGFTIDELGPKWREQQLSEQAKELILDYTALTASGIDVGVVTEKMASAVNDYLAIALRTGTEVPQAMRPILEKMIELGLLTNENGEKLTDLSTVPFSETSQGLDRVIAKLEELIRLLGEDLPNAINDIPDVPDITPRAPGTSPRRPMPGSPEGPTGAALGGVFDGPMNVHVERGRREMIGDVDFMSDAIVGAFERLGASTGGGGVQVVFQPGAFSGAVMDSPRRVEELAERIVQPLAEVLRTSGAARTRMQGALEITR